MSKVKKELVLRKDDYETLISYIRGGQNNTVFDRHNAEELEEELKKAKLVSKDDFPPDVVRLNSKVKIVEKDKDKEIEIVLVTPDRANIKERKVSILTPIGTALIGFRKGQTVNWEVPAGPKTFTIMEVINDY